MQRTPGTLRTLVGLDLISTGVLLLSDDGRILHANAAAEHVLQLSRRQLTGVALNAVLRDAHRLHPIIERARTMGASFTEQELELHLAGRTNGSAKLVLNVTAVPVEADHESGAALLLELRPIDQQVRIAREERVAVQSQANRELVRNLAHEIKNPLGGLRGAAQLLEGELSDPQLVEYTQVIIREADRLQALVNRLLTPHRLPRYTRQPLHPVLDRVLAVIRAEFGATHTLRADFDVSLPDVECDAEQITQVVLNIVRNACQSSASVAAPAVTLRTRVARQVVLARRLHRIAFEIAVIDNGPGVPPEYRDRVFFPLFTLRKDGTGSGLGLSIAQTFVAQHLGAIEFDSEPGHTVFRVVLPFARPADEARLNEGTT
jgi:two-component system nitrogen regulation sensor histidine kinase GlnL